MTPSQLLVDAMLDLLAADTATLSKAALSENEIALVVSSFVPTRALELADLTLASFTGSAVKKVGDGDQLVAYDPLRGEWFIELEEIAGGWTWVCTAAPASAQTVYGAILTNGPGTDLYGAELLPAPVVIANVGDSVHFGSLRFYESDLLVA